MVVPTALVFVLQLALVLCKKEKVDIKKVKVDLKKDKLFMAQLGKFKVEGLAEVRQTFKSKNLTTGDQIMKEFYRELSFGIKDDCGQRNLTGLGKIKCEVKANIEAIDKDFRKQYPYSPSPQRRARIDFQKYINRVPPHRQRDDNGDCFFKLRKRVRSVPGNCYGKLVDQWTIGGSFDPFISEIFNDLRYTFDYVLYEEGKENWARNRFWYLILYLKMLALNAPDPALFVDLIFNDREELIQMKEMFSELSGFMGIGGIMIVVAVAINIARAFG